MPGLDPEARKYVAEAIGTMVLMLIGPGTAIIGIDVMGTFGIALAFGFALLIMAYTIGDISGCHINPAVTLSFVLAKKIDNRTAGFYMGAQVVGAVVGGLLLYIATEGGDLDQTGVFASNGWGDTLGTPFGLGSVIVVEILFTAILTFVVLGTTTEGYPGGFGGLAVGLTLAGIHLATIPVDNTSVNPARSIGAAVFAGSDHLAQLWAFIVFPLIGGALGWAAHALLRGTEASATPTTSPAT
jgi:aquaporin Z